MRILITSGPTRAPLDAVRFLSSRSTGRFGTLLAREALRRGVRVTLIHGRGSETPPPHPGLRKVEIETNRDLATTLKRELTGRRYDAVIHAMAVLDFQPVKVRRGKVGSRKGTWVVRLVPTRKIIHQIRRWAPQTFLVGFKLEVRKKNLFRNARHLLRKSHADLVVANQLGEGTDRWHAGYLIDHRRGVSRVVGKSSLAKEIIKKALAVSREGL